MKKALLVLMLVLCQVGHANNSIEISILTCAPGEEVYSVFGHSSIRVIDHSKGTDEVYNFGMFNFDTPNFAYKFLKGQLQYHLGIQQTRDFIRIYTSENRLVSEQTLALTDQQEREIISKLKFLYRPENRYYTYSFQDRNCSTELRDILKEVGVQFLTDELAISARGMINSYIEHKPWLKLGVSLIAGKSMDQKSDHFQSMFLPEYLRQEVDSASLNGQHIVQSTQDLNYITATDRPEALGFFSPLVIFTLLLILFFFWFPKPIKVLFCTVIGITGLVMLTLWLFSGHPELKNNLNLIWCSPFYLLYIPMMIRNRSSKALTNGLSITLLLSAAIWLFQVQSFDIAVLPILLMLSLINYREARKPLKIITQESEGLVDPI